MLEIQLKDTKSKNIFAEISIFPMASEQNKAQDSMDEANQKVSEDSSSALDTITQYRNAAQMKSAGIVQGALENYEKAKKFAAERAGQIQGTVQDKYDQAGETTFETADKSQETLQQNRNEVEQQSSEIISRAREQLSKAYEQAAEAANKSAGDVKGRAEEIYNQAKDIAYSYSSADAADSSGVNVHSKASESTQHGREDVGEKSQGLLGSAIIKQYAGDIYGAALGYIKKTQDKTVETAGTVKEQSSAAIQDAKNYAGKANDTITQTHTDQHKDTKESASQTAESAYGLLKEKASQFYTVAQEQTSRAFSGVKEAAGDIVHKEKTGYAEQKSVEAKDTVYENAKQSAENSKNSIETFKNHSGQQAGVTVPTEKDNAPSLADDENVVSSTIGYVKETLLGAGDGGSSSSSGTPVNTDDSASSDQEGPLLTHVSVHG